MLWALDYGLFYLLSILLVVWIADSSAYFTGRLIGRKKLAPEISPKKTREGVYGALIANILFVWICMEFQFGWIVEVKELTNVFFVLFLVICATVVSVLGDLFQSLLKREAKVKDSGKLLPGHGGFYDRFDAVIAVSPFLMFSVKLVQ
jgi:phosphatidate cytidylyltransferase